MSEADAAVAPIIKSPEGARFKVEVETPQKRRERKAMADAIAITIIKYLVDNTEVIIPEHPSAAAMTGPAGGAVHQHSTNMPPIDHRVGKIR